MHQPVLLTLASEGALIDVDSTLFIQLILFGFMGLVASKLLFRPYLQMREERDAGIDGARADADRLAAEGQARLADYEQKLSAARAKAHAEQRTIRAEAAEYEREVTEKARAKAQESIGAARSTVNDEVAKARAELIPKADELARELVSKLLNREVA